MKLRFRRLRNLTTPTDIPHYLFNWEDGTFERDEAREVWILPLAIEWFFAPDASIHHPLIVESGPHSRERIIQVYNWYRAITLKTDVQVNSVVYNTKNLVMYFDATQSLKIKISPFALAPSRFIVRIGMVVEDDAFYIKTQEFFFQPTDMANYFFPPISPIIRSALIIFPLLMGCAYAHFCSLWIKLFGEVTCDMQPVGSH
ncbi:hypothetical protein PAXINDRAFT_21436 [Paxillus involutus ATCC 200175]|uniref:SigF-like NTF2-like domain-containing protein n=1 Tax=Paxillus involutus ATCC 200175 TaxID=664439 RepID=A0A0C9STB1_PAXIN|nr:hypothetical protein PAXINDRAFT_21436 [Paxillus involutus ATCC 200175]